MSSWSIYANDWNHTAELDEESCVTWKEAVRIIQDVSNKGDN